MSELFNAAEALERLRASMSGEWISSDEAYTPDSALLDLQRFVLNDMERSVLFGVSSSPEQAPDATSRDLPDRDRMDERPTDGGGRAHVESRETRYGCNCVECAPRRGRDPRRCEHDVVGETCEACTRDRRAGIQLPNDPRVERERATRPPRLRAWLSTRHPVTISDLREARSALARSGLTQPGALSGWRLLDLGEDEHGHWYMFGTGRRSSSWLAAHRVEREAARHTSLHSGYFDLVVGTTGRMPVRTIRGICEAFNETFGNPLCVENSWRRDIFVGTGDDEGWEGATEVVVQFNTPERERETVQAATVETEPTLSDMLAEGMSGTHVSEDPEREWAFREDEEEDETEEAAVRYANAT